MGPVDFFFMSKGRLGWISKRFFSLFLFRSIVLSLNSLFCLFSYPGRSIEGHARPLLEGTTKEARARGSTAVGDGFVVVVDGAWSIGVAAAASLPTRSIAPSRLLLRMPLRQKRANASLRHRKKKKQTSKTKERERKRELVKMVSRESENEMLRFFSVFLQII